MNIARITGPVLIAVTLIAAVGCGDDNGYEAPKPLPTMAGGSPVATRTALSAATVTRPTSPTVAATAPATSATSVAAGSSLSIVGKDIRFDKSTLEASAGTVTITFDHQDAGVAHNIALYLSKDDLSNAIAKTEIETGPVKQLLTVELSKGSYYFQCDVHPAQMNGTLIVR